MRRYQIKAIFIVCLIVLVNSVLAAETQTCCYDLPENSDYTSDGVVDIYDLSLFANLWLDCYGQYEFSNMATNWHKQLVQQFEAESGFGQDAFPPFTVSTDPQASGGQYISVNNGRGNNFNEPDNEGVVSIDFVTEQQSSIWLRSYCPSLNDDSFWLKIDDGNWITWNSIPTANGWGWKKWGDFAAKPNLLFKYANGSSTNRRCKIYLNGNVVDQIDFLPTGSWSTWSTVSIETEIDAGINTIKVQASTSNGGPNLDRMRIIAASDIDDFQAEDADSINNCSLSTEHSGYAGSGYLDFGGSGSSCQWDNIGNYSGLADRNHTLSIGWREDGALLDKICIASEPEFEPQGMEGIFVKPTDPDLPETAIKITSEHVNVWADQGGRYGIYTDCPLWIFEGDLGQAITPVIETGNDSVGGYQQIAFLYGSGRYYGRLRLYQDRPVVLCNVTCLDDVNDRLFGSFPQFTSYPKHLNAHGFDGLWSWNQFDRDEIGSDSPAVFYDNNGFAFIISPAANFMDAWTGFGDSLQCGMQPYVHNIPTGFKHSVMLTFDQGINKTFDTWGYALTDLQGKVRPTYDADKGLKYLGYWTDNGGVYYYKYDENIGNYEDTLIAVKQAYEDDNITLGYLQLDSWWYYKAPPEYPDPFYWDGLYLYEPIEAFFPNGLADFRSRLGLPFITHNRWLRDDSPYRDQYQISGNVSIDPAFWDKIIGDIAFWGVETYEQDWLDIKALPDYVFGHGDLYLDNMARACEENGLTMQYCMGTPRVYMQSSKYSNLTTLRVSHDRFYPSDWAQFFYCSRFVRSLGAWPWVDVFRSTETDHMLLCILSAGMAGMADSIGGHDLDNVLAISRHDGVLVKPDVPIVPSDSSYIRRAKGDASITGFTYSDFDAHRVVYVFDWLTGDTGFIPAEFGLSGDVYIYDYFNGTGMAATAEQVCNKNESDWSYYVVAPIGQSGIAFLGDKNMFVSCGKNRIHSIIDDGTAVNAAVMFAPHDNTVRIHGYSPALVNITSSANGVVTGLNYSAATGRFEFNLSPKHTLTEVGEISIAISAN